RPARRASCPSASCATRTTPACSSKSGRWTTRMTCAVCSAGASTRSSAIGLTSPSRSVTGTLLEVLRLMDLRAKDDYAIQTAKRLGFQGAATQEGDKLHFKGTVHSEDEKNQLWNALKTVPDWQTDINADIQVAPQPAAVGTSGAGG